MVTVIVERAQGTEGQVEVEWRTSDITAKSSGKTPIDYQVGFGYQREEYWENSHRLSGETQISNGRVLGKLP